MKGRWRNGRATSRTRRPCGPTWPVARQVLQRYNVRYLIVGPVERLYYPATGLAKFATMAELRVAYENEGVRVYEVR